MLNVDKIIAHRGASAYAPENTLVAFERAKSLGCHFIEFDVMLSQDDEPFVFHDENLKRTTNGRGRFDQKAADDIRKLDAGKWFAKQYHGEPIPTLRSVLDWLVKNDMQANIEIKPNPGKTEETTVSVLTTLNRYWPDNRPWPLLSSFEIDALKLCRNVSPEIPLGLLLDKWDANWCKIAEELHCYSVHISLKSATKARIEEIKSKGYKVFVYTVNRKKRAVKLFNWGVDALFSDYPDLLS